MATRCSSAAVTPTFHLMALACCTLLLLLLPATKAEEKTSSASLEEGGGAGRQRPSVFVAILARNTAHTLPDFLGYLERLDYPKQRMSVW